MGRQVVVVLRKSKVLRPRSSKEIHVAMVVKPVKHLDTEAGKRDGKGVSEELPPVHHPLQQRTTAAACTCLQKTRQLLSTRKFSSTTEWPFWQTQEEKYYHNFKPFSLQHFK